MRFIFLKIQSCLFFVKVRILFLNTDETPSFLKIFITLISPCMDFCCNPLNFILHSFAKEAISNQKEAADQSDSTDWSAVRFHCIVFCYIILFFDYDSIINPTPLNLELTHYFESHQNVRIGDYITPYS